MRLWNQAKDQSHLLKLSKPLVGKQRSKSLIHRLRNSPKNPSITDLSLPRTILQVITPFTCQKEKAALYQLPPSVITSLFPYTTRCFKKASIYLRPSRRKAQGKPPSGCGIQGYIDPGFFTPTFAQVSSTTITGGRGPRWSLIPSFPTFLFQYHTATWLTLFPKSPETLAFFRKLRPN